MSRVIPLIVKKDKISYIKFVPIKYLSMKQKKHLIQYSLSTISSNNNNNNNNNN